MKLTASFELDEFSCHDGQDVPAIYVPNVTDLCVGVLQKVRDRWGALVVVSGWRSKAHNTAVGGALSSTHLTGSGADVRPLRFGEVAELYKVIEGMYRGGDLPALGGLGLYRGWLHVDIKKSRDGHLRRWQGKGLGSEPSDE
jgi:uncharacterized protein YcbK (DUF882 family)